MKAGGVGAIEAIVSAMKTHIDNADVCEQGCGSLKNITKNNGTSHTHIKDIIFQDRLLSSQLRTEKD